MINQKYICTRSNRWNRKLKVWHLNGKVLEIIIRKMKNRFKIIINKLLISFGNIYNFRTCEVPEIFQFWSVLKCKNKNFNL